MIYSQEILKRLELGVQLLEELKKVYEGLSAAASEVEKYSAEFFVEFYNENSGSIQGEIEKYRLNIEKFKRINYELTEEINCWYDFTKSTEEIKRLLFPLKFIINKKNLKARIKYTNDEIYNITIANRLVRENILNWEKELEAKAIQKIKYSSNFSIYEQLISRKNVLVSELMYLLPTLPLSFPLKIHSENIDNLIKSLKNII